MASRRLPRRGNRRHVVDRDLLPVGPGPDPTHTTQLDGKDARNERTIGLYSGLGPSLTVAVPSYSISKSCADY